MSDNSVDALASAGVSHGGDSQSADESAHNKRVSSGAVSKFLASKVGKRWSKQVDIAFDDLDLVEEMGFDELKRKLGWVANPGKELGMDPTLASQIFGTDKEYTFCSDAELTTLLGNVKQSDQQTYEALLVKAWKRACLSATI